jgi:hypothetical protein
MHVCKATIQDYKKIYFKNPGLFPDFLEKKSDVLLASRARVNVSHIAN